jgi:hypothetical protein
LSSIWGMCQAASRYKYGIGSVLCYQRGDDVVSLFDPANGEILIRKFNLPINGYMVCSNFALEGVKLFTRLGIEEIQSAGFVCGSTPKYSGHCTLVLSKKKNTSLYGLKPDNPLVQEYLREALMFDICELTISPFHKEVFEVKKFTYVESDDRKYNDVDDISTLEERGFLCLGLVSNCLFGVGLSSIGQLCLKFRYEEGSEIVKDFSDFQALLYRHPELGVKEVHCLFDWYCDI